MRVLAEELRMSAQAIEKLSEQAQQRVHEHWSRPRDA